ncbi:MAG: fructosamine kinase family protein [Clostridiales bacterium]|nr:fructosamine kinase family protein [Clostridiales bacterium]
MEPKQKKNLKIKQALNYAKLAAEKRCNCSVLNIKYAGGGYFGYVYCAETDKNPNFLILKVCLCPGMKDDEEQALALLRQASPVPVPEVYFSSYADDEIPVDIICMERMNGKDVLSMFSSVGLLFISKRKKQKFADDVVTAMGAVHSKTNSKFGPLGNAVYDNWLDYYKPFALDVLNTAKAHPDLFSDGIVLLMERAWNNFGIIFSEPVKEASLVHGDLNVANIMCDKKLNVTAFIDPLESKWADKEFDLFQLRNFMGDKFHLYELYKSKYSVSEMVDAKSAFYGLFNEVYCSVLANVKLPESDFYVQWMKAELENL